MVASQKKDTSKSSSSAPQVLSSCSSSRKRSLLTITNAKPPPKTDTTLQLEKLLYNNNHNKRQKKRPRTLHNNNHKPTKHAPSKTRNELLTKSSAAPSTAAFGSTKTSLASLLVVPKKKNQSRPAVAKSQRPPSALSRLHNKNSTTTLTTKATPTTTNIPAPRTTKASPPPISTPVVDPPNESRNSRSSIHNNNKCKPDRISDKLVSSSRDTTTTNPLSTTASSQSTTWNHDKDTCSSESTSSLLQPSSSPSLALPFSPPPQSGTSLSLQLKATKRNCVARRRNEAPVMSPQSNRMSSSGELAPIFSLEPPPKPDLTQTPLSSGFVTTGANAVPAFLSLRHSSSHYDPPTTTKGTTTLSVVSKQERPSKPTTNNDNFVRLNLRNSAGACRGARPKANHKKEQWKRKRQQQHQARWQERERNNNGTNNNHSSSISAPPTAANQSRRTGLDPLDDYLDGVFVVAQQQPTRRKTTTAGTTQSSSSSSSAVLPKCARHQLPCKLLVVKKNTKGNKGRQFYACSMPKGEQCDHFEWADDTVQAAQQALCANQSYSGFVARQVAAYTDRFRQLTVPELRVEAQQRGLTGSGKKQQLVTRLSVWVRDELSKIPQYQQEQEQLAAKQQQPPQKEEQDSVATTGKNAATKEESLNSNCLDGSDDNIGGTESNSDDGESSDEELEFFADPLISNQRAKVTQEELKDSTDGAETEEEEEVDDDDDDDDDDDEKAFDRAIAEMDLETIAATPQLRCLREIFGFSDFRPHQEWAIQRCLDHKRTLLVAPTGFGKSLCYAVPAAMMEGICIVVSPLISLIQDQLRSLPPRVPAATLSGSLTAAATAAIIDDIVRNRIKVLFISPERLVSASFRRLFRPVWDPETRTRQRTFPDISLLQWAHNFRPCFLRFKHFLGLLNPKSVLAITATAEPRVVGDICNTIGIEQQNLMENRQPETGIRILKTDRDNIDVKCLPVSSVEERLSMLSKILLPPKARNNKKCEDTLECFGSLATGSVIVYVWRQKDTEVVAENLIDAGVEGGVVIYHGGMDASARSKSQSRFMRGKARICVATVAFGLGIDKADIEGIIHVNLSASLEHYLQEIGRAGRDGRSAKAIAMPLLEDIPIRHSLVHTDLISCSQVKSVLLDLKARIAQAMDQTDQTGGPLHVLLPLETSVVGFDCKPETIETILSLIERDGGDSPILHVEGITFNTATVALKKRPLSVLAKTEDIARAIKDCSTCVHSPVLSENGTAPEETNEGSHRSKFEKRFLAYGQGAYAFSIIDCVNRLGPSAEPRHVFAALRRLQSNNELELSLDTTAVGRGLHVIVHASGQERFMGPNSGVWVSELAESLTASFHNSVTFSACKVVAMYRIMNEIAEADKSVTTDAEPHKSAGLVRFQELTAKYFSRTGENFDLGHTKGLLPDSFHKVPLRELRTDTARLLADLPQLGKHCMAEGPATLLVGRPECNDYSVMTVAKFLHGIDTPRAPMKSFYSHPLFGKWRSVEFASVKAGIETLMEPAPAESVVDDKA